jgi:hypothetical protein
MLTKGNDYLPGIKCYSRQSTIWNNYIAEKKNGNFLLKYSLNQETKQFTWKLNLECLASIYKDDKLDDEFDQEIINKYIEGLLWNVNMYTSCICNDYEFVMPKDSTLKMGNFTSLVKKNNKEKISNIYEAPVISTKDHPFPTHIFSMCVVPKPCYKAYFNVNVYDLVDEKLMHLLEKGYTGELNVKKISDQSSKLNKVHPPKTTLTLTGGLSKWNIGQKLGHIQIHNNLHIKDDKVLDKKVKNSEKRKREQDLQQSSKKQKLSLESGQQNAKKKDSEEIPKVQLKKKASKVETEEEPKNQPKSSTKSKMKSLEKDLKNKKRRTKSSTKSNSIQG